MTWVGRTRLPQTVILWTVAVVFQSSLLLADHQQFYREGIAAADNKQWDDVVSHMRNAINLQPQPGERIKIYGMRFEKYLPHYYLGLALYHLGDCGQAVKAWDRSESYGETKGSQYRNLTDKREECRAQLPTTPPPSPVSSPPTTAPHAPQSASPPPPPVTTPPPVSQADRPPPPIDPGSLVAAEKKISNAEHTAEAVEDLRRDPSYSANRHRAELERQELRTRKSGLLEELSKIEKDAQETLLDARQWKSRQEVRRVSDLLEERLREIGAVSSETDLTRLSLLRDQTANATTSLRDLLEHQVEVEAPADREAPPLPPPPTFDPPQILRSAVEFFLKADYQGLLATLDPAKLKEPRAQALAYLLSAAARYALFAESQGDDEKLESAAAADVEACRSLDPHLEPSPKWFSPDFIMFFQGV